MHQVVARLDALAPEAGAAVRVIRRFDELLEGRAGLEPILAAVAVLTGWRSSLKKFGELAPSAPGISLP